MILIYGIMNEIKFRGTQNAYMWLILKQGLESIAITILNGLSFTGESKGTKSFPTTWSANNQKIQLLMFNRLPYLFLSKKPSSIRKRAWGGDVIQPFGQTVYRLSKLSMQKARRDSLEVQKPSANKANGQRLNHHKNRGPRMHQNSGSIPIQPLGLILIHRCLAKLAPHS